MSIISVYIHLYIFYQGIWKTKKKCSGKGEYVRGIHSSTRSRKSTHVTKTEWGTECDGPYSTLIPKRSK